MQAEVKIETVKEEIMEVDEEEVLGSKKKPQRNNRLKGLIDSDSEEDDFKPTPTQVKENGKSAKVSKKRSKKTNKKDCPPPKRLKKIINQHDSDSDGELQYYQIILLKIF